ncbi:MAG: diguanylate cyclase domain-containing protein [bacterium]
MQDYIAPGAYIGDGSHDPAQSGGSYGISEDGTIRDELMLVLPGSSRSQAEQTVERLISAMEASEPLRAIKPPPYFSYGLAEFRGDANGNTTPAALIQPADKVMYNEKRRRRGETAAG